MSKFYGVVKNGVLIGMKEVHSVIASTSHKRLTKEEYKLRSVGDTFDGEVWTAKADAAYKTYTYDRFLKRSLNNVAGSKVWAERGSNDRVALLYEYGSNFGVIDFNDSEIREILVELVPSVLSQKQLESLINA